MTSETIQPERVYPAGHRNRHAPRLCPQCAGPLTADGLCTHSPTTNAPERPRLPAPARITRLQRMERAVAP